MTNPDEVVVESAENLLLELIRARIDRGWPHKTLMDRAGLSPNTLINLEKGLNTNPSGRVLFSLAHALGYQIILRRTNHPTPPSRSARREALCQILAGGPLSISEIARRLEARDLAYEGPDPKNALTGALAKGAEFERVARGIYRLAQEQPSR